MSRPAEEWPAPQPGPRDAAAADLVATQDLDQATLRAVRGLLDDAYGGDFDDHDWQHTLGGLHALVCEGSPDRHTRPGLEGHSDRRGREVVAHGSVVPRILRADGRLLHAGYVEGVAVRADRRGRGMGAAVMSALEGAIRQNYDLGALSTTDQAALFYRERNWVPWRGRTAVLTPDGLVPTPKDDDSVLVLRTGTPLALTGTLVCEWREGDVW